MFVIKVNKNINEVAEQTTASPYHTLLACTPGRVVQIIKIVQCARSVHQLCSCRLELSPLRFANMSLLIAVFSCRFADCIIFVHPWNGHLAFFFFF